MKTSMQFNGAITVLLFLVAILSAGGCGDKGAVGGRQANPERQVEVVPAATGDIKNVLHLTGDLVAVREVEVTTKIPGKVEKVLVEEGSYVKAGDVLIELEREELALAVAQANAAVITAEAGLAKAIAGTRKEQVEQAEAAKAQAKANADICKITFERMAKLLEDESIPRTSYDEAKARHDVALAQHKAALAQVEMAKNGATKEDIDIVRAQVGQAKAALASVEKQYRNAVITSPIDGVVAHRRVEPGEVVLPPMMPGGGLIQILDTSVLKTLVNISENQVKAVRLGQKAEIALDGFPGENFSGNVSRISPVVDSQSRTFEAEILMSNPDGRLKPGMFARVQLVLAERKGVVIAPLKAVSDEEQGPQIFVAGEGTAHARPVTLGISDGIDVEVVSGVEVGEMIIVKGNLGLEAGTKIVVEKE